MPASQFAHQCLTGQALRQDEEVSVHSPQTPETNWGLTRQVTACLAAGLWSVASGGGSWAMWWLCQFHLPDQQAAWCLCCLQLQEQNTVSSTSFKPPHLFWVILNVVQRKILTIELVKREEETCNVEAEIMAKLHIASFFFKFKQLWGEVRFELNFKGT